MAWQTGAMDVENRGVGVDTAGLEACHSWSGAGKKRGDTFSTWRPAFDPELEVARGRGAGKRAPRARSPRGEPRGDRGRVRSPDDDPGTSVDDPTRRRGPLADLPSAPPRARLRGAGGPAYARGHPSSVEEAPEDPGPASLRLEHLGPPRAVVDRFVAGGVRSGAVYPWQRAAIDEGSDGSNLVYCAPTSGGKSLVANVLLVARSRAGCAGARPGARSLVLPFQSLVNEKVGDLKRLLAPMRASATVPTGARGRSAVSRASVRARRSRGRRGPASAKPWR